MGRGEIKRAGAGEKGNESAWGTLGREKKRPARLACLGFRASILAGEPRHANPGHDFCLYIESVVGSIIADPFGFERGLISPGTAGNRA